MRQNTSIKAVPDSVPKGRIGRRTLLAICFSAAPTSADFPEVETKRFPVSVISSRIDIITIPMDLSLKSTIAHFLQV